MTRLVPLLLLLGGAALLAVPALRYRLDSVTCAGRPTPLDGTGYGAIYLLAVALLTAGWLGKVRQLQALPSPDQNVQTIGRVLWQGALVHALALIGPPFLSQDVLFYAAIGRVTGTFHHHADEVLRTVLPSGDPFLTLLPLHWQAGNSAYGAGFDALAALVARLGGDHLRWHLRIYQLLAMASMLLCAGLTGLAVRKRGAPEPSRFNAGAATALVVFCPLAIIEATQSAHNDSLLAVALALALLLHRAGPRRGGWSALPLAAGVLVKASALLPLGLYGIYAGAAALPARLRRGPGVALMLGAAGLFLALAMAALLVLREHLPGLRAPTALLGSPAAPYEFCTRSVECLPRIVLRHLLHAPTAAWVTGLAFRVLSGLWLLFCALRGSAEGRPLRWAGSGLFLYYLYLHGWSQSWYLLPLLPLLPFAAPRLFVAARVYCVSAVAYYALVIPLDCVTAPLAVALTDLAEAIVEIIPPTIVLLAQEALPEEPLDPGPAC